MVFDVVYNTIVQATQYKEYRDKIAIIEPGIDTSRIDKKALCNDDYDGHLINPFVPIGTHGTEIFNIISKGINKKTTCILPIKWNYMTSSLEEVTSVVNAIRVAVEKRVKIINVSLSGTGSFDTEKVAIQNALKNGIVVNVAAGNKNVNLSSSCTYYPACYGFRNKNFHVVGDFKMGRPTYPSNYGSVITNTEDGKGGNTSYATAFFTVKLANTSDSFDTGN